MSTNLDEELAKFEAELAALGGGDDALMPSDDAQPRVDSSEVPSSDDATDGHGAITVTETSAPPPHNNNLASSSAVILSLKRSHDVAFTETEPAVISRTALILTRPVQQREAKEQRHPDRMHPPATSHLPTFPPITVPRQSLPHHLSKKSKHADPTLRSAAGTVWKDPTLADWPENDFRIFVGDLGVEVTDAILSKTFSHYTSFALARVVRDKKTDVSRGYGFVSFTDHDEGVTALKEMQNRYCGSRPMKLKRSDWQKRGVQPQPHSRFKRR